jgi:hypothetical protein
MKQKKKNGQLQIDVELNTNYNNSWSSDKIAIDHNPATQGGHIMKDLRADVKFSNIFWIHFGMCKHCEEHNRVKQRDTLVS